MNLENAEKNIIIVFECLGCTWKDAGECDLKEFDEEKCPMNWQRVDLAP